MNWFRKTRISWNDVIIKEFESPREICEFVRKNIRYKAEPKDRWCWPKEAWTRGRGDCEEFAVIIHELCMINGFVSEIYVAFSGGFKRTSGHVYVIGDGWFSSNGEYKQSNTPQLAMHEQLFWPNAVSRIVPTDTLMRLCLRS